MKQIEKSILEKRNIIQFGGITLHTKRIHISFDKIKKLYYEKVFGKSFQKHEFNEFIRTIKEINIFNINSNFWSEYENIPNKEKYRLPENIFELYKDFFDKTTWYELLHFDTSIWYQTINKCINVIKKLNIEHACITTEKYNELIKIDSKLPIYPYELFRLNGFISIEKNFNQKAKILC